MGSIHTEEVQRHLRQALNRDKVKLWESPYSREDGTAHQIPENLILKYSEELRLSKDVVAANMEELRLHAVRKLASRRKFQTSGVATLKIKLAGKGNLKCSSFELETTLQILGKALKKLLSEKCGLAPDHLKPIAVGRVIKDDVPLSSQHISNNAQVLVICLSESEAEAQRKEEQVSKVRRAREGAELLADTLAADDDMEHDGNQYGLQIADQTGRALQIPREEKRALTVAMALNERGKAALKRKQHGEALLLLLEADREFQQCRSEILQAVDNYAILCLDIVWCYLCLKNVTALPDAENRLQKCEQLFHKSYGSNLERLTTVKADAFLRQLQVDESKLTELMTMGFSGAEARLGLRACSNNVQAAVTHIMQKQEERREIKKKEQEERRQKKLAKKLGKTANGDWVKVDLYNALVNMGFPKGGAVAALQQTNNNIQQAIQVLQDQPELLTLPDPNPGPVSITDEMLAQLVSLGFDPEMSRRALQSCQGMAQRAIDMLLQSGGVLPGVSSASGSTSTASSSSTSSSSAPPSSSSSSDASPAKSPEELQKEREAYEELASDLADHEEDYLDLTLEEESVFLQEYRALLASTLSF
ncbi:NUB1 [Branchiostoma lanceolatum]|uniref:NUB1 protein n=1 Tax=Branchiostoma lanceolatum TaxID=7740 RepID=A0A8J9Z8M4_BRALA|nr:NUB1 [Branchiostoma lanceolatum]